MVASILSPSELGQPAQAADGAGDFVTMAEDAAGDAPEGFDLTALKVRRVEKDIEFRFELDGLTEGKTFPQSGTVWWYFNTDDKSADWWVVADIDTPERYYMMWSCCYVSGGGWADSWEVEGEYNWKEGYISVFVPVSTFGGPGTALSHCHPDPWFCSGSDPDVLVHSHLGSHHAITVTTIETDSMMTTRPYVIPRKPRN